MGQSKIATERARTDAAVAELAAELASVREQLKNLQATATSVPVPAAPAPLSAVAPAPSPDAVPAVEVPVAPAAEVPVAPAVAAPLIPPALEAVPDDPADLEKAEAAEASAIPFRDRLNATEREWAALTGEMPEIFCLQAEGKGLPAKKRCLRAAEDVERFSALLGIDVLYQDRDYAEQISILGEWDGKHNTICLAKRCLKDNIPGDFVECGVGGGGHPALMAYVAHNYSGGAGRKVHLFDSFQGHPMAGAEDEEAYRNQLGLNPDRTKGIASGVCVTTRAQVQQNMVWWKVPADRLVYHEGWLQEVLPALAADFPPIALLRIDVDLHDSTIPVFEHLYDKISPGGYIISDDWGAGAGYDACRQAVLDFLVGRGLPRPKVTRLPRTGGTVWWQKPR